MQIYVPMQLGKLYIVKERYSGRLLIRIMYINSAYVLKGTWFEMVPKIRLYCRSRFDEKMRLNPTSTHLMFSILKLAVQYMCLLPICGWLQVYPDLPFRAFVQFNPLSHCGNLCTLPLYVPNTFITHLTTAYQFNRANNFLNPSHVNSKQFSCSLHFFRCIMFHVYEKCFSISVPLSSSACFNVSINTLLGHFKASASAGSGQCISIDHTFENSSLCSQTSHLRLLFSMPVASCIKASKNNGPIIAYYNCHITRISRPHSQRTI